MASVTSLDGDLRKMRLDKYTPGAAREARTWIEGILGEQLAAGDLLEALKDGVALCRLANMAIPPPGIRFKQSAMPFVQMENISHFLRVCQAPPLNLQQHDCFLTVDLYEAKDPAQVLQCLGAFSRAANRVNPSSFPTAIGPKAGGAGNRNSVSSPQNTGYGASPGPTPASPPGRGTTPTSGRPMSSIYSGRTPLAPTRTGDGTVSGRWSPTKATDSSNRERSTSPGKSPTSTSSWSKRELEGSTAPAWNIAQYGYMGGASQGNLGISFGGRRQITSAGPSVPNAAEKERLRKEKEAEEERARQEEEERRRAEQEAEEERARQEEQLRWEEETRRQREEKKRKAEEEKRKWEEEERQWKLTEEARIREEEEAEARLAEEREQRLRSSNSNKSASGAGNPRLRGQFLSQYQADQTQDNTTEAYSNRVRELEKELELARQREQAYERERQGRSSGRPAAGGYDDDRARSKSRGARSRSRPRAGNLQVSPPVRQESWSRNDKEVLRTPRSQSRHRFADQEPPQQQTSNDFSPPQRQGDRDDDIMPRSNQQSYHQQSPQAPPPSKSPRPLPDPRNHYQQPQQPPRLQNQWTGERQQQQQPPQQPPRLQNQRTGERQQQQQQPPPPQQQQQQRSGPTSIFQKIRTHRTGEKNPPSNENNNSGASSPIRAQRTGDGPNKLTKSHGRPLPDPSSYASPPQYQQQPNLPSRQQQQQQQPPLQQQPPQPTYARELLGGGVAEHDAEDRRRRQQAYNPQQQQQPLIKQRQPFRNAPPAMNNNSSSPASGGGGGGRPGAGKSLLEREMEMERQRQREWEEAQRATAAAPRQGNVDGVDGRWDVNQWSGYTGGDGQNRGSQGIGAGRRQIVGPRPLPGQR